ncbi:branched-chain amino acid ABC transporter substrate-binding protein [Burkholderia pyrrocinia]|uniref:branched-chain amino acid ABC transporter substrate-binding protein n=1 Tax=Burkholderia pyrrocinia TaxID=60550 RepID=UPI001576C64B|nr:branched-chain amino acid ABC transporter substrate-binding protein [Burkholderia pyrrocinia]NTX26752.1 branched-chain amino acid ABC transporter substrate-binding protein [Burkholderia pyrrocinia]
MSTGKTAAIAASALLLSFSATANAEIQTIMIGSSAPMTGAQAQYGKDFESGVQLAIDDFNATSPKIDGKDAKATVTVLDDQADPKTATVVAQKFVDMGVKGIVGHFNSGTTIPASAVYYHAGIPQISTATSPAYIKQGFKSAFRAMTSDTQQGSAMGTYVVKTLKAKRIAIIDDRTAYGQGLAEEFEKSAKAAGGNIVDHQFMTDKAVDFRAILTSIKAKAPDFIYYAGADAQSAPLLKQARSLAIRATFGSGDMSKSDDFVKIAGSAADSALVTLAGLPLERMPRGTAFAKRYRTKYGTEPTTYAPYSYDATMAILQAMQKAKSSNPSVYLPVLAKTDMQGVTSSHFAFDQQGDLRSATITVYKSEGGKWAPVAVLGQQ